MNGKEGAVPPPAELSVAERVEKTEVKLSPRIPADKLTPLQQHVKAVAQRVLFECRNLVETNIRGQGIDVPELGITLHCGEKRAKFLESHRIEPTIPLSSEGVVLVFRLTTAVTDEARKAELESTFWLMLKNHLSRRYRCIHINEGKNPAYPNYYFILEVRPG